MKKVITISTTALAILSVFFISSGVYATEASSDTEVDLELATVLNITTPETSNINCVSLNTLCTSTATVAVGTNNSTGYTLQLNATNGYSNNLTNVATNETIPTLAGAYASGSFPTNYWGYTGGTDKSSETGGYNCASNYCPILAYQSNDSNYAPNHVIKVTDAPATTSNTNITFGAKVDISKPSGTYSTSVTFTAVINYVPPTKLADGLTMQDVTSSVCANSDTDVTYTLTDSRDGKEYTVAKLQDDNCWMTQNLALGGSSAMTLTQADSDVGPSGFTLPASVSEGSWSNSLDNPEFFDYAGNYPSQQSTTKYGNYYNWPAATAGSGTSATTSGDVQYSICPKNWRLPSAGTTATTGNELYAMLDNYITTGIWDDSYPDWPYWHDVTTANFTDAPISLVFSGSYSLGGNFNSQGNDGFRWSSTACDSTNSYYLVANSNGLVSRGQGYKGIGGSIRCLVPGQ